MVTVHSPMSPASPPFPPGPPGPPEPRKPLPPGPPLPPSPPFVLHGLARTIPIELGTSIVVNTKAESMLADTTNIVADETFLVVIFRMVY